MTTTEFLSVLEQHAELPLSFEYQQGAYIRTDYHITEIKNVTFDTVDCGGVRDQWNEVHVQLWESPTPQPTHAVDTTKALKIFQVVEKVRATFGDVELKFEYGNAYFHAAVLPVGAVKVNDNQIIVQLGKEQTTCKAKDRAVTSDEKDAACCGPAVLVESKPKISLSNLITSNNNSCTPGGGCC